jgi:exosortase/archaeosortase family protein
VTTFDVSRTEIANEDGRVSAAVQCRLLYLGVTIVGFANGISEKAATEIQNNGIAAALFNTLGVSIVIWAAGAIAVLLLLRADQRAAGRMDFAVAVIACATFLVPAPFMSWLGIALAGIYLYATSAKSSSLRRAGTVLLALTVPMLWARILFAAAGTRILEMDAKLVSWIVGTQSSGNTIPFADGSGVIFLEPACSSLTNVSLAMLCGVLFVSAQGLKWSKRAILATLLACAATVFINVFRIALIGVMPQYYSTIHGPTGAAIAGWVTILTIIFIFTRGIRRDATAVA